MLYPLCILKDILLFYNKIEGANIMADAIDIADYIVDICNKKFNKNNEKYPISNLYLQKLMYFLNVIHMLKSHLTDKAKDPLITNEKFEAWDYGPVLYGVYEAYHQYGGSRITKPAKNNIVGVKIHNGKAVVERHDYNPTNLNANTKKFINDNINSLLNFGPFQLVGLSHKENQWKHKHVLPFQKYSNSKSLEYYNSKKHRFWEK